MKISSSIQEVIRLIQTAKNDRKTIGFVPTMGALHKGHLSLIEKAKKETQLVVVSIFINPTQFNNPEDLEKYPVTTEADLKHLEASEVDLVFLPSKEILYTEPNVLAFSFGYLESVMEGASRPGHFSGVATVVSKLFNIIQPDTAFFGQKDIQQVAVIKALVRDLSYPIKIATVPTCREINGLAMSSRNMRLTTADKEIASEIYKSLLSISSTVKIGQAYKQFILNETQALEQNFNFKVEYLELVNANNLKPVKKLTHAKYALCFAGELGGIRLIDNLVFDL